MSEIPKEIPKLIDTIMRLRRSTQAQIAEKSGLHRSNLSRFLSGDIDIRLSSLEAILQALDINLEDLLQKHLHRELGPVAGSDSLGEALEVVLKKSDPITARTLIDSLLARTKGRDRQTEEALGVIRSFKSKLRIVRRA